jgi:glc operon protein GlcG
MAALVSNHSIGFEAGSRVMAAAVTKATELGISMCVAVVDRFGALVIYSRMDGAPLASASLAQDKAWTSVAFRVATHELWDSIHEQPSLVHGLPKNDRVVTFGGGAPILCGDETVGAVGVSGGTPDDDQLVAEFAAALDVGVLPS